MRTRSGQVLELRIDIPLQEVLRYLGYPRAKCPSERVQQRIESLAIQAHTLVRARGAYVFADRREAEHVGMPKPPKRVAFGVCTIGHELEQEEARLSAADDPLGALILDAFGSAAAEEAAEALHACICAAVQGQDLRAGRRVSPGYGKWSIVRQVDLLARLPTQAVGVHLNEASMMAPRKSVSFAAVIAPAGEVSVRGRCAACELTDCPYRRDERAAHAAKDKETS